MTKEAITDNEVLKRQNTALLKTLKMFVWPHQKDDRHSDTERQEIGRAVIEQCNEGDWSPWTRVEEGLPNTDNPERSATVWAVCIGCAGFPEPPRTCQARFHQQLGWQPLGSTGWDWQVTHWLYLPEPPTA